MPPKKKAKKAVETASKNVEKESNLCGICFEEVKERGIMEKCDHVFCFSCLFSWSEQSTSCPNCRAPFTFLTKFKPRNGETVTGPAALAAKQAGRDIRDSVVDPKGRMKSSERSRAKKIDTNTTTVFVRPRRQQAEYDDEELRRLEVPGYWDGSDDDDDDYSNWDEYSDDERDWFDVDEDLEVDESPLDGLMDDMMFYSQYHSLAGGGGFFDELDEEEMGRLMAEYNSHHQGFEVDDEDFDADVIPLPVVDLTDPATGGTGNGSRGSAVRPASAAGAGRQPEAGPGNARSRVARSNVSQRSVSSASSGIASSSASRRPPRTGQSLAIPGTGARPSASHSLSANANAPVVQSNNRNRRGVRPRRPDTGRQPGRSGGGSGRSAVAPDSSARPPSRIVAPLPRLYAGGHVHALNRAVAAATRVALENRSRAAPGNRGRMRPPAAGNRLAAREPAGRPARRRHVASVGPSSPIVVEDSPLISHRARARRPDGAASSSQSAVLGECPVCQQKFPKYV